MNDAPARKAADTGIALGITGTDVAKKAADMILLDDNFATIVSAVEEGRAVFENLRNFLTHIPTSNILELVPCLAFVLFKIPLPLTVIQILAVDLGSDVLPALALGAEAPHAGLMREPPDCAANGSFHELNQSGWRYGEALERHDPLCFQATAACLAVIVLVQAVDIFLCRHTRQSALRFGLPTNPLLLWGIALEVGLILLIVTPPGGTICSARHRYEAKSGSKSFRSLWRRDEPRKHANGSSGV